MTEEQLHLLFTALESYLDKPESGFKKSHVRSIGEIEERNPWRETNWRSGTASVTHFENVTTPGIYSAPIQRHIWKASIKGVAGVLQFSYGHAPFKRE